MGRHFECTDEIIVISEGKKDIGKVPALGNDGKLDPSMIPDMVVIAGRARPETVVTIPLSDSVNRIIVPLELDKVIFDNGEFFGKGSKINIKKSGTYLITGEVNYECNPKGSRFVVLRKNGTEEFAYGMSASNDMTRTATVTTSIIDKLSASDYIELCCIQISDSNLNITPESCQLSIVRLGD